jgi:hypothetical protein
MFWLVFVKGLFVRLKAFENVMEGFGHCTSIQRLCSGVLGGGGKNLVGFHEPASA